MIPLKDNIPSGTVPVVNVSLIVVNIIVFFFEVSLGRSLNSFILHFGFVPARFFTLLSSEHFNPVVTLLPLVTSLFLHGGWLHVGGNMLYLWIFGDNVEDVLGHLRYLFFYLLCGIGASVTHLITNAASAVPTVGASGAIAGVMGAYFVLFPRARVVTLIFLFVFIQFIEIPALYFLAFWFLLQLVSGSFSLGSSQALSGGVAFWAHVGGFVWGIIFLFLLRKERRGRRR
jgi:membrane associated rhomboid family serine protease